MLLNEPLAADTVIAAALLTTDERASLPVTLRVVHLRQIRTGDYFLGAQFEQPITAADLRPFLAEPLPAS